MESVEHRHNYDQHDETEPARDDLPSDRELKRLARQEIEQAAPNVFTKVAVKIRVNDGRREMNIAARGKYGLAYPELIENIRRRILNRFGYLVEIVNFLLKELDTQKRSYPERAGNSAAQQI